MGKRESEGFLHEENSEPESLVLHDMQCEKLMVSVNFEEVLEELLRPFQKRRIMGERLQVRVCVCIFKVKREKEAGKWILAVCLKVLLL